MHGVLKRKGAIRLQPPQQRQQQHAIVAAAAAATVCNFIVSYPEVRKENRTMQARPANANPAAAAAQKTTGVAAAEELTKQWRLALTSATAGAAVASFRKRLH